MHGMTLEQMKDVDIRAVDPDDLVDIRDVKICTDKSKEERITDFVRQIRTGVLHGLRQDIQAYTEHYAR